MNKQRGISLIVVLIGLVIISFAAVALFRSTDTGTLVAGNLTFKKTALAAGDAGTEAAITWVGANAAGTTLHTNVTASGYYATSADACDLTGSRTPDDPSDDVDWIDAGNGANCNMTGLAVTPAGVEAKYSVRYVINRMCNAAGNPNSVLAADGITPMSCSRGEGADSDSSTAVGPSYSRRPFTGTARTYYRITTRITGPRNTARYVQAFVAQ